MGSEVTAPIQLPDDCPVAVAEAICEITRMSGVHNLTVRSEPNRRIRILFDLSISLPSRGTFEGVDIRELEPIALVVDAALFPDKAPDAFVTRPDFPDDLPHVTPLSSTGEAWLCLHRGKGSQHGSALAVR